MADFTAEVFQNEFLPDGGTDVHAIVRVTSTGATAGASSTGLSDPGSAAEVILTLADQFLDGRVKFSV